MTTIQQDNLCNIADYMQMTDESVFKMHKEFFGWNHSGFVFSEGVFGTHQPLSGK